MKKIKNSPKKISDLTGSIAVKFPSRSKLPFFTLAFILSALILTVVAVQQQQNLIQEAARLEECPDENTSERDENGDEETENDRQNLSKEEREERKATRAARRAERGTSDTQESETFESTASVYADQLRNGNPGQLVVKYKTGRNKTSVEDKVRKRNGRLKKRNERNRTDVVIVPQNEESATISELRRDPDVAYVEREFPLYSFFAPNDSHFGEQYALHNTGQNVNGVNGTDDVDLDAPEAWDKTQGNGMKVAILDSGIQENHPDLTGKVIAKQNFTSDPSTDDTYGHGTFIAGIIAANTNNAAGIAGICPDCKLLSGKVVAKNKLVESQTHVAEGIQWAVDQGANVIVLSLGSPNKSQLIEEAINVALANDVLVVAAAGNCGVNSNGTPCSGNPKIYPAAYSQVLSVASADSNGDISPTSGHGNWVDVVAPGVNVLSTTPTYDHELGNGSASKEYAFLSGTSFSAPYVAGVAALAYASGITSADEVRETIEDTSEDIDGSGDNWKHGFVNAAAVVEAETDSDPDDSGTDPDTDETDNGEEDDDDDQNDDDGDDEEGEENPCKEKKDKNKKEKEKKNKKGGKDDVGSGKGNGKNEENESKNKKEKDNDRKKNSRRDNNGWDPNRLGCNLFPNLPYCSRNGGGNDRNNQAGRPCPSGNSGGKNSQNGGRNTGGSGKDGQENVSNNSGNVNIGNINDDETSNTRITVNGKEITGDGQTFADGQSQNIGDINTGGKQGGSHRTEINIDSDGTDETVDRSGSDGNNRNNNGGNGGRNSDDCLESNRGNGSGGNGNAQANANAGKGGKKNDAKNDDKGKGGNGGGGGGNGPLCRFAGWLPWCGGNNGNDNNRDDKKNDSKKNDDKKKDDKKKNVKGATTTAAFTILEENSMYACMAGEKSCTPVQQKAADRNNDGKVNRADYDLYMWELEQLHR